MFLGLQSSSRSNPAAGFSLIEVMVATAVLLVAVQAAYLGHVQTSRIRNDSRERDVAMAHLHSTMEQVLTRTPSELLVPGADITPGPIAMQVLGPSLPNESLTLSYLNAAPGDDAPDILLVRLSASWRDSRGADRSLDLVASSSN